MLFTLNHNQPGSHSHTPTTLVAPAIACAQGVKVLPVTREGSDPSMRLWFRLEANHTPIGRYGVRGPVRNRKSGT